MPDPAWRVWEAEGLSALPEAARALFAQQDGLFSSQGWYGPTVAHALPDDARAVFLVVQRGAEVASVWPMRRAKGRQLGALTTPYTCLWGPLLAPAMRADRAALERIGFLFGRACRAGAVVRLDAMDADDVSLPPLLAGVRAAGLRALRFDHFGNWHAGTAGLSWDAYLAGRQGALREAIRRRGRKFSQARIIAGVEGVEEGIAQYEQVYAASWKQAEPFPGFNAALMRACAAEGSLRLGILHLEGVAVAAQFWVVRDGCAYVLKLAHDEKCRGLSPGTVLMAQMIRRMLDVEGVSEIDFGRGDDAYKAQWTGQRRQRIGFLLVNPFTLRGLWEIGRRGARRTRKHFFFAKKKQKTFMS